MTPTEECLILISAFAAHEAENAPVPELVLDHAAECLPCWQFVMYELAVAVFSKRLIQ